jgi:solute carrier family 39 (zinc transporter), member 9
LGFKTDHFLFFSTNFRLLADHHHQPSSASPDQAIIGLLVHCVADGLAMGAAFLSGNASLSFVIATAMVLHKAPMAFGLGSYLRHCQWSWTRARPALLAFSAAAPSSTLITYWFLSVLPFFTTPTAVALVVLFSGGTFLHAATMHIMPEVLGGHGNGNGHRLSSEALLAVMVGALVPVLLSWGHHH